MDFIMTLFSQIHYYVYVREGNIAREVLNNHLITNYTQ